MKVRIHAAAGTLALLTIVTFWSATVVSELFGSHAQIATLKMAVLWGMLVLIPAMATAGATGAALGKRMKLPQVAQKAGRMKIIAANGILILLPSAVFLALRSASGQFDTLFYTAQAVELLAGIVNISLLARNMKDGLAIRARLRAKR
jgi:hypothetical protein